MVVLNISKNENKYKEFSGRDYSRFNIHDFVKVVVSS